MLQYTTVHACTCSALTSAFVYAGVNQMDDSTVTRWTQQRWPLLFLPMMKFVCGCMAYMVSVILTSWRDLQNDDLAQTIALIIGKCCHVLISPASSRTRPSTGVMSVASVWMALIWIKMPLHEDAKGKERGGTMKQLQLQGGSDSGSHGSPAAAVKIQEVEAEMDGLSGNGSLKAINC